MDPFTSYFSIPKVFLKKFSQWFVFQYYQKMLQVKLREYNNPRPAKIGIDEHAFRRNRITKDVDFINIFVENVNKRLRAIVLGRNKLTLLEAIKDIKGATAVRAVSMDLSGSYREFVRELMALGWKDLTISVGVLSAGVMDIAI